MFSSSAGVGTGAYRRRRRAGRKNDGMVGEGRGRRRNSMATSLATERGELSFKRGG